MPKLSADDHAYAIATLLNDAAGNGPLKMGRGGEYLANCPGHSGDGNNLSVSPGRKIEALVLSCRSMGCDTAQIMSAAGLREHDLWYSDDSRELHRVDLEQKAATPRKVEHTDYGDLIETYVYTDELGTPVLRVRKHEHGKPHDWFIPGSDGVSRVSWAAGREQLVKRVGETQAEIIRGSALLYRMVDVYEAPLSRPVVLCEGESDADAAHEAGLLGCSTPFGAGASPKYTGRLRGLLAGRRVAVVVDNDGPGVARGQALFPVLTGFGCTVRILRPPTSVKDLRQHLESGGKVPAWLT